VAALGGPGKQIADELSLTAGSSDQAMLHCFLSAVEQILIDDGGVIADDRSLIENVAAVLKSARKVLADDCSATKDFQDI
jgi:hypothetical protein